MIRVLLSAPLCLHIRLSSRLTCWPEMWIVPIIWLGFAGPRSHQRPWLRQGVAAVDAGDGSRIDGSCLVIERRVALPGAAVAPGADSLSSTLSI